MTQRPAIRPPTTSRQHSRGFGIVELMIAMALGLFLIGGAISVFVTNQQAYRTTEQLSRMQESGRTSVELMARQVRETGGNPCGRNIPTANVINNPGTHWWANWSDGIRGYDNVVAADGVDFGTGAGERIEGTDAVFLLFGNANSGVRIASHNPSSAQFKVNTNDHALFDGEIVMVCNYEQAAILQVTNASSTNPTVVHNSGTGTPGNCTKALGTPVVCDNTPGASWYEFKDGFMMRLTSELWYIGANGRGGRSLYRARLVVPEATGIPGTVREEIAEGVTNLQMTYLQPDATGALPTDYVDATAVTAWSDVSAVRITLTLQSLQNVGTDGAPLQRQMTHVATLRNRLP